MKHLFRAAALAAILPWGALQAAPVVTLTTDRADALYKCGEMAAFTLEVADNGVLVTTGSVDVSLGVAAGKSLLSQKFDLAQGNPIHFTGTLDEPGFLLAVATGVPGAPKALAGAGFEPERIVPGHDLPEDFASFWEDERKKMADKPVRLDKLTAFPTPEYTSYTVTVDVLNGEHLYGFLTVPNQPGKHPVVVTIPGAGPGIASPITAWAKRGVISLVMNVHKYPVITGNAEATAKLYQERTAKVYYPLDQAGDRERYHYHNVILGLDRVLTEITGRPDWDGRHLVLDGSSQGGGLSLVLAGLNPRITAVAVDVPALGDHAARRFHRAPGWPDLAAVGPQALEASAYYDTANFARSIHCPVLVSAGFIDITCPPSSVYAAWNRIPDQRKEIQNMPKTGHRTSQEYKAKKASWLDHYLGLSSSS